jgi:uncharacterized membrane protein YqjE
LEHPGSATGGRKAGESLQALAASMLALVRTRLELVAVEFREEGERRKQMALLGIVAGVFFALAALLFAMFIVVLFWDSHRVAAAAGVTVAYLAIALGALASLRSRRRELPPPFEASLAELARDVEALRGGAHE